MGAVSLGQEARRTNSAEAVCGPKAWEEMQVMSFSPLLLCNE